MYQELTVVQGVGVVGAGDIGLVGGELGVLTLDLCVSQDLRKQLTDNIRAGSKVKLSLQEVGMGSEMLLHITWLGSQHRCYSGRRHCG